jgi:hypothetical protein
LNNQKTAVRENSVLRFIHNREALIELELSMYKELEQYQWQFFGNDLKERIEGTANDVCEYYKQNNGISKYVNEFVTTPELIDAQIGVLNTYVEMTGVMETILLRVSVLRTGGIERLFSS